MKHLSSLPYFRRNVEMFLLFVFRATHSHYLWKTRPSLDRVSIASQFEKKEKACDKGPYKTKSEKNSSATEPD